MPFKFFYKTKPFEHQRQILRRSANAEYFAILAEQGTGKTKVILDNFFYLWGRDLIEGALILAPKGVHSNWVRNELGLHFAGKCEAFEWDSKVKSKKSALALKGLMLKDTGRFRLLAMNIEAIRTKDGAKAAQDFLKSGNMMMVIDESTVIKNRSAQQTKAAIALGKKAGYRRILTGTPITQNPVDIWSQCQFLHSDSLPYKTFTAFKDMFAVEVTEHFGTRAVRKIESFKNLEVLQEDLKNFSMRVLKEDCLDLPEKIYQRVYIEMDDVQRKAYVQMLHNQFMELQKVEDEKGYVHATNVVSALLKLQQIVNGWVKDTENETYHDISNTKLDTLKQVISRRLEERSDEKFLIWAHFHHDIHRCIKYLAENFPEVSTLSYYGGTGSSERVENVDRFQHDDSVRFLVCNSAASRGLTLTRASTAIYYSNSPMLETRLQSEDRCHRIGQTHRPVYVDLLMKDSVDEKILTLLSEKKSLADRVIGWKEFFTLE